MSLRSVDVEHGRNIFSPGTLSLMVVGAVVIYLVREAYRTDFPKIEGIPEIDGALPFVGHQHLVGGRQPANDSTVYAKWAQKLSSGIIQCTIGDQRTIVVSKFLMIKELWVLHANSLLDRPHQPGFVDKLGVDITGFSMTEQLRRCRQAAMRALAKPMWPKYYHLLEPTSVKFVKSVYERGQNGELPIDVYAYCRQIVFDLCLSLTYGARFGEVDDAFILRFIKSINNISAVRSSTKTYRHFVPLLRFFPERTSETIAAEKVRRVHRDKLYNSYKERVANGETVDCIVASLGEDKLTEDEIHGTCLSILQAAPDTVASGIYQCLAWLSSQDGQPTQAAAYSAIVDAYDSDRDRAWNMAFREEKVPLITSLYKETLRFFTVTPYATPRRTSKEISYNGATIPKGITIIMNSQEANHDTDHFGEDAWKFNPSRFIGNDSALPHLTFGAGARICPAVAISSRILYAMLTRLILAFEMREVDAPGVRKPNIHPIDFSDVYGQLVAHPRFYDCSLTARDEAWLHAITTTV